MDDGTAFGTDQAPIHCWQYSVSSAIAPRDTAEAPLWSVNPCDPDAPRELLDCSPIVCDVGLAIQLGISELARLIFVFGRFGLSSPLSWWSCLKKWRKWFTGF